MYYWFSVHYISPLFNLLWFCVNLCVAINIIVNYSWNTWSSYTSNDTKFFSINGRKEFTEPRETLYDFHTRQLVLMMKQIRYGSARDAPYDATQKLLLIVLCVKSVQFQHEHQCAFVKRVVDLWSRLSPSATLSRRSQYKHKQLHTAYAGYRRFLRNYRNRRFPLEPTNTVFLCGIFIFGLNFTFIIFLSRLRQQPVDYSIYQSQIQ